MPRPRLVTRPVKINLVLPGDVAEKLKTFLTSSRTGEIPQGAYQRFFVERIEEYFRKINTEGDALLKEMLNEPRE